MIAGLGLDMIEVNRVAEKIGKESGFREMIFTLPKLLIVMGTGWLTGTAFNEVEMGHNEQGQPQISLLGKTTATIEARGSFKILVSLSHLKAVASAL